MSIRQRIASTWKSAKAVVIIARNFRRQMDSCVRSEREWFVKVPEWFRPEMIAKYGTVRGELETLTAQNRRDMARWGCVGIQFDTSGERHRWPWLEGAA